MQWLLIYITVAFCNITWAIPRISNADSNDIQQLIDGTPFKASKDTFQVTIKTFKKMEQLMKGIQENVLSLANKLESYQEEDFDVQDHQYTKDFNKIRTYIKGGRQELKVLAHTTVTKTNELKELIGGLGVHSEGTSLVLLIAAMKNMKTLIEDTLTKTKNTRDDYNMAIIIMNQVEDDVKIALTALKNGKQILVDEADEELKEDFSGCIVPKDVPGSGFFSFLLFALYPSCYKPNYPAEDLSYLQNLVETIEEQSKQLDKVLNNAESFLDEEIDIIAKWESSAENLQDKLEDKDSYSVEIMKKITTFKNQFIRNLQELHDSAQMFLNQPTSLFD